MRPTGAAQRLTIVDSHRSIRGFLPEVEEMVTERPVIRYVGTNPDGVGGGHAPTDSPGGSRWT